MGDLHQQVRDAEGRRLSPPHEQEIPCQLCGGESSPRDRKPCVRCGGTGVEGEVYHCEPCNGTGSTARMNDCPTCGGIATVTQRILDAQASAPPPDQRYIETKRYTMRIRCAWCLNWMSEKTVDHFEDHGKVSHGICPECLAGGKVGR